MLYSLSISPESYNIRFNGVNKGGVIITKYSKSAKNHKPLIQEKELAECIEKGMTINHLVERFGCIKATINKYLDKYNLKTAYCDKHNQRLHISEDTLRDLVKKGLSYKEMAQYCNCSVMSVYRKVEMYNLMGEYNKNQASKDKRRIHIPKAELIKLIQEHKTISEIAEIFNCSLSPVKKAMGEYDLVNEYKKMQIKNRKVVPKLLLQEDLEKYIEKGMTIEEMAQVSQVSKGSVQNYLHRYNLMESYYEHKIKKAVSPRKIIPEELLREQIELGCNLVLMAVKFGCSTGKVKFYIKQYNLSDLYRQKQKISFRKSCFNNK